MEAEVLNVVAYSPPDIAKPELTCRAAVVPLPVNWPGLCLSPDTPDVLRNIVRQLLKFRVVLHFPNFERKLALDDELGLAQHEQQCFEFRFQRELLLVC